MTAVLDPPPTHRAAAARPAPGTTPPTPNRLHRVWRGRDDDPGGRGRRCSRSCSAPPSSTSGGSARRAGRTRTTPPRCRPAPRAGAPSSSVRSTARTSSRWTSHRPRCGSWASRRGCSASMRGASSCRRRSKASPRSVVLYATVRRWFSPAAALAAGAVLASSPVAALMFRFNNPDALLVLLLVGGAYAMTRALESGRTTWLLLAFSFVGFGFLAKMLQALLVVPAFGLVYLFAGPPQLGRRIGQLALGAVALVVSAGWWIAAVQLTPASARPYVGGSQDNSLWNLIFGYNGFGRLTGNETGSVGGNAQGGGQWGPTGILRMFNTAVRWTDLVAAPRRVDPARRGTALHGARAAHRPQPRRVAAVGRLAARDRRRVQPRSRHHPPLLLRRARAGDRCAGRHRYLRVVAAPRQHRGPPLPRGRGVRDLVVVGAAAAAFR